MAKRGGLSVWETIVLHLARFSRFRDEFEVPVGVTQEGIATGCGVSRAHAALELGKLIEKEKVVERLAHVRGARTKKKVYFLTDAMHREALKMREAALGRRLAFVSAGKRTEMAGDAALQRLTGALGMSEARAIAMILSGDDVDETKLATPKSHIVGTPPPSCDAFFGRKDELEALKRWLSGDARFVVISGMRGIGKSSLAARGFADCGLPTLWYRASPLDSAKHLVVAICAFLGASDKKYARLAASSYIDLKEIAALLSMEGRKALVVVLGYSQADDEFNPLMQTLAESKGGLRFALCCDKPTSAFSKLDNSSNIMEIRLNGLDDAAAKELLSRRGITDIDTVTRLTHMTGGHPLALSLIEPNSEISEKDALRRLVRDVLGALPKEDLDALIALAVHRVPVPHSAIMCAPLALDRLLRAGLASEGADGTIEAQPTVKAIVLSLTPPLTLREMHSAAEYYCRNTSEHAERLYHLWKAGRRLEIADHLRKNIAAIRADGRSRLNEVVAIAADCCVGKDPALDMSIAEMAFEDIGRDSLALNIASHYASSPDTNIARRANILIARAHARAGRLDDCLAALSLVKNPGVEGLRIRGAVERRLGHHEDAPRTLKEALNAARMEGDGRLVAEAACEIGVMLLNSGNADEAARFFKDAVDAAKKAGNIHHEAMAIANLALCHAESGKVEEASAMLDRALSIARKTGRLHLEAGIALNLSHVMLELEDYHGSAATANRALELLAALGSDQLIGAAQINLGRALLNLGKREEGIVMLEEGVRSTAALEDRRGRGVRYLDAAVALCGTGVESGRKVALMAANELRAAGDEERAREAEKLSKPTRKK